METFELFLYANIYCVGAGKSTFRSISDGLSPYMFRRKMEKTRPMGKEMDGELFISRQSRHFIFVVNIIKVLFPFRNLTWRINICVSRQESGTIRRNEVLLLLILERPF